MNKKLCRQSRKSVSRRFFSKAPIARAVAFALAAGGVLGEAQAQQAFSPAWFAAKGANQATAAATGLLPNGLPANTLTAPAQQSAASRERLQQSIANLSTAAQAVALQQALQQRARQDALLTASNIPDGLAEGGLKIDNDALTRGWSNAEQPTQSTEANGTVAVTIEQTAPKAVLNWETFNVGQNTSVYFDQRAGTDAKTGSNEWIALNRVNDPSARPSQIAGQIRADGSVYIINRNGIVFTGTSQINTRGLVASTLSLSDEQFERGINNPVIYPDAWNSGSNTVAPVFGDHTPVNSIAEAQAWTPSAESEAPKGVTVEAGAELSVSHGGKLMLFGTQVDNAGSLNVADGQIILAAGEQVWLSTDVNGVRGLDVAVSGPLPHLFAFGTMQGILGWNNYDAAFVTRMRNQVLPWLEARAEALDYHVANTGSIHAERGNVTLQAREVTQDGVVTASTALNNLNGSIRLRAWGQGTAFNAPNFFNDNDSRAAHWSAGNVTLGEGSVTLILPDAADTSEIEATAVATRYTPGWIEVDGKQINLEAGSLLLAPSGTIEVIASARPQDQQGDTSTGPSSKPGSGQSTDDGSRIYVDSGAVISVAGLQGVEVAMDRSFIEVDLRINELRDSPLLRDGWLYGQTVVVDGRASGTFDSGVMSEVNWGGKPGEWFGTPLADVSAWIGVGVTDLQELSTVGGSILLKSAGDLITREGSLLDISGGSVAYAAGWNTSSVLLGADGLMYTMANAPSDIEYVGIAGQYVDEHARWDVSETYVSPILSGKRYENGYVEGRNAGSLQMYVNQGVALEGDIHGDAVLGERQAAGSGMAQAGAWTFGGADNPDRSWLLGELVISDAPTRLASDFDIDSALTDAFTRGTYRDKTTWLDASMLEQSGLGEITLYMGGDFTLEAGTDLVFAPSTALSVFHNIAIGESASTSIFGNLASAGGEFYFSSARLGDGAVIDVSGQWINNILDGGASAVAAIDGGSVTLGSVQLDGTASVLVNGGGLAWLEDGKQKLKAGNAGSILLTLGVDDADFLSRLDLGAWAAGSGGSLTLNIGGGSARIGADAPGVFTLPENLYGDLGFRAVNINMSGSLDIADGAQAQLVPLSWDMDDVDWRQLASGADLADALTPRLLREEQRAALAPVSLNLTVSGADEQGLRLGEGARLAVDTGGAISLQVNAASTAPPENGPVTLLGSVEAPAGSIAVRAAGDLRLAEGASLLARGVPLIFENQGLLTGQALDGGSVSLHGRLTLEKGSLIDVSGASGVIEFADSQGLLPVVRQQTLASDGGSISLTTGMGFLDATLLAHGGGEGASGGALFIKDTGGNGVSGQLLSPTISTYLWYEDAPEHFTRLSASNANLNLFGDEYAEGVPLFTSTMRGALNNLPLSVSSTQGLILTEDDASSLAGAFSILSQNAWEYDSAIDERVVQLLNDHFWYGNVSAKSTKINIGQITVSQSGVVVSAPLIREGGFSSVTLDSDTGGLRLADGVDLAVEGRLDIGADILQPYGDNAAARVSAAYLSLSPRANNTLAASTGGSLRIDADVVNIASGSSNRAANIRGFADTVIDTGELRFSRDVYNANAILNVAGALTIEAGRVYPETATNATISATDSITVLDDGNRQGTPWSAGGSLTLSAPVIEQYGALYAPFGSINLAASQSLTLGAGSLTSVAGDGLTIPYGSLGNAEYWLAPYTWGQELNGVGINQLPDKRVTLEAPRVDTAEGAVVDIRGGGDLYAYEFVPGTGGSHNVLAFSGAYAVLPGFSGIVAPGDTSAAAGQRIWLAGGNGLAAGWYTLLPSSYAALPGAYLILPASGGAYTAGGTAWYADGSAVMAGKLGNALDGSVDDAYGAWQVMEGEQLRLYSEYNEAFASSFFASDNFKLTWQRLTGADNIVTPRLTMDAGSAVFKASESLTLDGNLLTQADGDGLGGELDIAAARIAVVGDGQDSSDLTDYLIIDAEALSGFGADSVLLGGTRSQNVAGTGLAVSGDSIVLRNDAATPLTGLEIILAAKDTVKIEDGSVLLAKTDADREGAANDLIVSGTGSGALLRVSGVGAAQVLRSGASSAAGTLEIGAGAVIEGGAALLLDATKTTELAAGAELAGKSISVSAERIGLGGGSGLVLDSAALAQLSRTQDLTLHSYGSIDVYGNVDFGDSGLDSVTLDAALLSGHAGDVHLKADTLRLANSGGAATPAGAGTGGALTLAAGRLELGGGDKALEGFSSLTLSGDERIVATADGSLDAGDIDLWLQTPVLTGENAANQRIVTTGALKLSGTGADAADAAMDSLGATLALEGRTVEIASNIVAKAGGVSLSASGAGDLRLADGARVDVGGVSKDFYDLIVSVDAGRISLQTASGDIVLEEGALLDLSADSRGGGAGELTARTGGDGEVRLAGVVRAQASATGQGGGITLDTSRLADFAALSGFLSNAGFDGGWNFRVRNGDVTVDGVTRASDFTLGVDAGKATLSGEIEALSDYGGSIAVSAGNGIEMTNAAVLRAGATDPELGSGRVTLDAGEGALDLAGGVIDVAGGEGGRVRLRARQNATHDGFAGNVVLDATINGARSAVLEGVTVYTSDSVDAVRDAAVVDANAFADHAATLEASLGNDAVSVMSGIEIRSAGDLTLSSDWNLFADFDATQRMGGLTLRAAGDLNILGNLSDGFDDAGEWALLVSNYPVYGRKGALQESESWDLRLAAGADLDAANILAVRPLAALAAEDAGSVIVGAADMGNVVRTGTGDLSVAAGRDLQLAHANSALYTAGKADATVWDDFTTTPSLINYAQGSYQLLPGGGYGYPVTLTFTPLTTAAYGIDGGKLAIDAQASVLGKMSDYQSNTVFDWLRLMGRSSSYGSAGALVVTDANTPFIDGEQSTWYVDYARFDLGVGALGGGNVSVRAGGDIADVLVAQPTNGRVRGGRTEGERKLLELRNGGAFSVVAEGAIRGGQYYLGRGNGTIDAAALTMGATANTAPVLALGDASLAVTASGNLQLLTLVDPLLRHMGFDNNSPTSTKRAAGYMSGYTGDTALSLLSVGGDVTLGTDATRVSASGQDIYPVTTHITAFDGSVSNTARRLTQMSGDQTDLRILAEKDVALNVLTGRITPEALPSPYNPMMVMGNVTNDALALILENKLPGDRRYFPNGWDTGVDWTADDLEPSRVYSRSGNVTGKITMGEALWLRAGRDIRGITLDLRNNHAGDISLVEAGNDIVGPRKTPIAGRLAFDYTIQGPGNLLVTAGGDVYNVNAQSLGNYAEWSVDTNLPNINSIINHLPSEGASITVMAGINGAVDYAGFESAYLDAANIANMPGYLLTTLADGGQAPLYWTDETETRANGEVKTTRRGLVSFIAEITGETLDPVDALARFQSLPDLTRQLFLRRVFLQELREAVRDQNNNQINGGYNRGYAAIETLFPGDAWNGSVISNSIILRTLAGGDINVLAPGGEFEAAALTRAPVTGEGVITLAGGHINIFTDDSITVNNSRVLAFVPEATARGSDMIMWSSHGDVDAGRGAKTLRVPSAPLVFTSVDGMTAVVERSDISGSGIGTIGDGDVDLAAPEGTINAGDAGIRVAGNLNLAALRIVNADNIQVEGETTGLPVLAAVNIGALTSATAAGNSAVQAAQDIVKRQQQQQSQSSRPSIIDVRVLDFGGTQASVAE